MLSVLRKTRCTWAGAYLLGWKADAFQLRLSMLLERITMVVVRSYFSGSLCCPMLKGFTVKRSCSTCTRRTVQGIHILSITILSYCYITNICIIINVYFVYNIWTLSIYTYCSDAPMLVRMTLLPHAARCHRKPILLLQRKKPGDLNRKNEWRCAHAPFVKSLSVKWCCFTCRQKNRLSSYKHRSSLNCRQRMIICSWDACITNSIFLLLMPCLITLLPSAELCSLQFYPACTIHNLC